MLKPAIATILLATALPAFAQSTGDPANGETLFRKCAACHQVGEEATNRVGPVLTNVVERAAGTYVDYRYGSSMTAAGEAGLIWTPDNIFAYLENPTNFLKAYLDDSKARGKMPFRLTDEQERLDIVAYLSQLE